MVIFLRIMILEKCWWWYQPGSGLCCLDFLWTSPPPCTDLKSRFQPCLKRSENATKWQKRKNSHVILWADLRFKAQAPSELRSPNSKYMLIKKPIHLVCVDEPLGIFDDGQGGREGGHVQVGTVNDWFPVVPRSSYFQALYNDDVEMVISLTPVEETLALVVAVERKRFKRVPIFFFETKRTNQLILSVLVSVRQVVINARLWLEVNKQL